MAVGSDPLPPLRPVSGIRLGAVEARIRKAGRPDLVLVELAEGTTCAGVFTTNRFRAAPVQVAIDHLGAAVATRYLLVNTGNANAGTGSRGRGDALACCRAVAELGDCTAAAVLPFSTGVIGEPLPVARVTEALPRLFPALTPKGWESAARGILTTDTRPKGASETVEIDGRTVTLTGIAKGSGMIRPDMATMLAFIGTDAALEPGLARRVLRDAAACSFNRITVDGDTSTNDACLLMATGQSGAAVDRPGADHGRFVGALSRLCTRLARAIVRDGEGATREVQVRVEGGRNEEEAERVAFTVAESPLVKTAVFAADPNWGRILAAVGRAGIGDLDVEGVRLWLGDYCIVEHGALAERYREAEAAARMAGDEVAVRIDLGRGSAAATVWTCDFSCDYVKINADYRS